MCEKLREGTPCQNGDDVWNMKWSFVIVVTWPWTNDFSGIAHFRITDRVKDAFVMS